jgi:purine-binding chemotaxis protein CheW
MRDLKVVVFKLNNELCGVESDQVQEIVKYAETSKLPKMPKFIEGIINLRGKVVPIINLNLRFEGGNTEITKKTKVIITKIDENIIGFMVNDVTEILNLTEGDIEPPPEMLFNTGNNHLVGVGKVGGRLISILDFKKLLTSGEVKKIKKI